MQNNEMQLLENVIRSMVKQKLNEANDNDDDKTADKVKKNRKESEIRSLLNDPKVNHAEIMRQLWNPKSQSEEDTYRSLFSKKLRGEKNDNGSPYSFSDDEIDKLHAILVK